MSAVRPLLRTRDVAVALGVTEQTVREWLAAGVLPGLRLGGRWYVRPGSLESALDRLERERSEVGDHAARVLRGVKDSKRSRRIVVPPRDSACPPSTPSAII